MNATTLTAADFDRMEGEDEYLGWGYLGGRSRTEDRALVAQADAMVLAQAQRGGLTYERLFAWANSKNGRWFADTAFGGYDLAQARPYLPIV